MSLQRGLVGLVCIHSLLDFSKALDVIRINFGVGNVTVERPKVEPPLREPKKQTVNYKFKLRGWNVSGEEVL